MDFQMIILDTERYYTVVRNFRTKKT